MILLYYIPPFGNKTGNRSFWAVTSNPLKRLDNRNFVLLFEAKSDPKKRTIADNGSVRTCTNPLISQRVARQPDFDQSTKKSCTLAESRYRKTLTVLRSVCVRVAEGPVIGGVQRRRCNFAGRATPSCRPTPRRPPPGLSADGQTVAARVFMARCRSPEVTATGLLPEWGAGWACRQRHQLAASPAASVSRSI